MIYFGGNGGVYQSKIKLPDSPRHSWHNNFSESLLYYPDSTFHVNKRHNARNERELTIPLIKLFLDRKVYNYYEDSTILNKTLLSFYFKDKDKIIIKQQKTIEKLKNRKIF